MDVLRSAALGVLAAAVPPATIPAFGVPVVELFGAPIPVASMFLALMGLAMARGVSAAREGPTPGGFYLTGTLVVILVGIVIERQPGPGVAIAWGVGIGASGIVLVDVLKERVQALFGRRKGTDT